MPIFDLSNFSQFPTSPIQKNDRGNSLLAPNLFKLREASYLKTLVIQSAFEIGKWSKMTFGVTVSAVACTFPHSWLTATLAERGLHKFLIRAN